jgi:hypothetical protein
MVIGKGRFEAFSAAYVEHNSETLESPQTGGASLMVAVKTSGHKITPKTMNPELYARFLMDEKNYTHEEALKHVPFFGFRKENLCERINRALREDTSTAAQISHAQMNQGRRTDVESSKKKPAPLYGNGIPARLRHFFGLDLPTKSSLIGEFISGKFDISKLKENLAGLAMIGQQRMEKASRSLEFSVDIQRKFLDAREEIATFIRMQNPEFGKKILKALASEDCTQIMEFLLVVKGMEVNPEQVDDLFKAVMSADSSVRAKFLDPESDIASFIKQQTPEVQGKIRLALMSPNCGVAMSVIAHAKEMQLPLRGDFFDDLCKPPTEGRSYCSFDVTESIQSCNDTKINAEWSDEDAQRDSNVKRLRETQRKQRETIAFLEGDEIGENFFANENFDEKLDAVAGRLAGLQVFMDAKRDIHLWEIIIGGKAVSLQACPRDAGAIGVAKFFLQKLKDSGLPPEQAFKALKSLCRYEWIQGEITRPVTAWLSDLCKSAGAESVTEVNSFILPRTRDEGSDFRTRFEFLDNGNVKVSSMCMTGSKVINNENTREMVALDADAYQGLDLSKCYLTTFMSIECDSNGHHTILNSEMAFHR